MKCPKCKTKLKTVDTRNIKRITVRKRECPKCDFVIYTQESEIDKDAYLNFRKEYALRYEMEQEKKKVAMRR